MILIEVPGKVVLSGEYSVLLPGTPCVVAAVDRSLVARAEPAPKWSVRSRGVSWSDGEVVQEGLEFLVAGLEAVRRAWSVAPLSIETSDTFRAGEAKLGLGGSAAATVAGVLAAAHGLEIPRDRLWALADEAHRKVQGGRGSGADVAAAMHGGVIRYWRDPRHAWRLTMHPDVRLLLAWTGASAKTTARIDRWNALLKESPDIVFAFTQAMTVATERMEAALASGNKDELRGSVQMARGCLKGLEHAMRVELETPGLRAAADAAFRAGGSGKFSGAGGGDCAVLFAMGDDEAARVKEAVEAAGLEVFPVSVAQSGASVREAS